jgi:hypothetical protein
VKLHIIARGRIGQSPEAELVERYAQRLRGRLVVTEIGDTAPWPLFGIHLGPGRTVALDERGRDLPSTDLAALLARWRDDGVRETRFLIGAGRPGRTCWCVPCWPSNCIARSPSLMAIPITASEARFTGPQGQKLRSAARKAAGSSAVCHFCYPLFLFMRESAVR